MAAHADGERFHAGTVEQWWDWLIKTAPTRAKRIAEAAAKAFRGERTNQWPRR